MPNKEKLLGMYLTNTKMKTTLKLHFLRQPKVKEHQLPRLLNGLQWHRLYFPVGKKQKPDDDFVTKLQTHLGKPDSSSKLSY